MIFLLVDGDYFLTGFMPNSDTEVKEAVEQLEAALVDLIRGGDASVSKEGAVISFDVRVMFFSSAFFNALEEHQRKIVTSATRRVRFQITVLESVRGRTGSPVDAALCTKAITLAMMPKHGEGANRDSVIAPGQIFCFVTPNAYIASALGILTSRGCDALFAIYEGDDIAEELLGYISASYGTGIATVEKREGISFIPNTEAASAVLAALQREGKELPLAVVVQLKRLQDSLIDDPSTDVNVGVTQGAIHQKYKRKVSEELSLFSPPPLQGLPNPFAREEEPHKALESDDSTRSSSKDAVPDKEPPHPEPPENDSRLPATPPHPTPLTDPSDVNLSEAAASEPAVSTELPPGWILRYHPGSRRHYYVHTDSQNTIQSTWVHPLGQKKQAELERRAAANYHTVHPNTSSQSPMALPPNWEQRIDPRTGCAYFVNHITRETTWTRPENPAVGFARPHPQSPQPATHNPTNAQDEWESRVDPKTNRIFYVNHATRQTSWTRPGAPLPYLPPNWEAHVDPQTGRTFFINHETNESSWNIPV
ncbi:unnamed protein product [Phytomonas sp. Hart1]|nr:unnamed protein product [Phytomonas sp. Hart1]|eukprot:CCW71775.1 unnamed protein product [Phytomonas sp. isolate Hart1]